MQNSRALIFWAIGLGLISFGLYWQTIHFGAVNLDDPWYLVSNPQVNQGLSWQAVKHAFGPEQATYWHPMATLSAMTDFSLFGPRPGGHHFSSALIHAATAALFFLALHAMTRQLWPSLLAALLFAVHPINVEAVCWLTQRKTILTGLFCAAALLSYAHYARKPGFLRYLWVFVLSGFCVMSKPSAAPLPIALLLIDYWPLRRLPQSGPGRLILEKIPLLCLSLLTMIMTYITGLPYGGLNLVQGVPMLLRLENAFVATIVYLGKFFYSTGPTVYVPFPGALPWWKPVLALLLIAAMTALALRFCKKAPQLIVGLLWFLVFLTPVIGVIQAGVFPAWADRYAYLPYWGLYIAAAWTIFSLKKADFGFEKWATALAAVWVCLLGFSAWTQAGAWANDVALFSRAVRNVPNSLMLRHNYGVALMGDGRYGEAVNQYEKALALISPKDGPGYPAYLRFSLGNAHLGNKDAASAEREYKAAIALAPRFFQAYNNLGLVYWGRGLENKAQACFNKALEINPNFQDAKNNLEDMGRSREAPN